MKFALERGESRVLGEEDFAVCVPRSSGAGRWSHDEDLVLAALIIRIAGRPATRGGRHEFRKLIGARLGDTCGEKGGKAGGAALPRLETMRRPAAAIHVNRFLLRVRSPCDNRPREIGSRSIGLFSFFCRLEATSKIYGSVGMNYTR